ncbi:MAG: hypothetical protein WD768_17690 [Phycisphaeraceae bacterium]
MQEMTSTGWKRQGSSLVWHPLLLGELIRDIEPTPLRTLVGWLKTGFPDKVPSGKRTVLIGGLQTTVETMMQMQTPSTVADWLRNHALAAVRQWKSHWPEVGLVFVMDGPVNLFEFNEGDEIVYFGRGKDRKKKVKLSQAIWNGAASGAGAYQLVVPETKEVGGYFVRWLS